MEKTLEMCVEYILERCTGLETENRRLEHQNATLTEQNEHLMNDYAKQADKLGTVAKAIKRGIVWGEHPSLFLSGDNFRGICELLRIEKNDKATC